MSYRLSYTRGEPQARAFKGYRPGMPVVSNRATRQAMRVPCFGSFHMTRKWAAWIVGLLVFWGLNSIFTMMLHEMGLPSRPGLSTAAITPAMPLFLWSAIFAFCVGRRVWSGRPDCDLTLSERVGVAAWLLGLLIITVAAMFIETLDDAPVTGNFLALAAIVGTFVAMKRWRDWRLRDAVQAGHELHHRPSLAGRSMPMPPPRKEGGTGRSE